MKIIIDENCFDKTLRIEDVDMKTYSSEIELKRSIIKKIIDSVDDEDELDWFIMDLSGKMKLVFYESEVCDQCDDNNTYQEFEF